MVAEHALSSGKLFCTPGGLARSCRLQDLVEDGPDDFRIFLKIDGKLLVDEIFDQALHLAVSKLGLGLAFELGLRNLDADHRRQTFAHIIAGQPLQVRLLDRFVLGGILLDRSRKARLEAHQVSPALFGVDVVGKGEDLLVIGAVILDGDSDGDPLLVARYGNDLGEDRLLVPVQIFHKRDKTAFIIEQLLLRNALVQKLDSHPAVQKSKFPHALRKYVEAYLRIFENERVRLECYPGPPLLSLAPYEKLRFRLAALVALKVNFAVAPDFDLQVLAQRVYHGYADPVETAGNFVGRIVEFSARMKLRHNDRYGREVFLFVHVHRNAAPVVVHGDRAVQVNLHSNVVAVARESFVDAVVNNLVDKMMQTFGGDIADVHGRAHAHRAQPFKHGYLLRSVFVLGKTGQHVDILHKLIIPLLA